MHSVDLPTTVTYARDFEAVELKANHTQAQFSDSINQKLERYLADNHTIYQSPQQHNNQRNANRFQNQHVFATTVVNKGTSKPTAILTAIHDRKINIETLITGSKLRTITRIKTNTNPLTSASLSNFSLSTATTSNLSGTATSNILTTATSNLSNTHYSNTTSKPSSNDIREPKIEDHPKLEISNSSLLTNNQDLISKIWAPGIEQQQPPINNIPSATITENESLDAIFLFELEESSDTPLFSGAALEEKLIMAMYTNAKIDGHFIKLIFDSGSAGSIITQQLMDQLGCQVDHAASTRIITTDGATKIPIGKIDDFLIEVNGIIVPIKVLVIEATQYQVLINNDWLSKTNAMLDWTTQELVLSQNEKENKPTWEVYQVLWADIDYNKLLPILSWDNNDNGKRKQRAELTWETDNLTWTNNDELTLIWE
ncbi:hypothetical protein G9A89_017438 [Geosiphon pyriformis]|nr:hypothetical protein G9A89_017438 [Geosiphon pyriformis]